MSGKRRTLKEILERAERRDTDQIAQIMRELYETPVNQLYKADYRDSSCNPQKILQDLGIPVACREILNLGEIVCLVSAYFKDGENERKAENVIFRLAQLGYWY